MLFLGYVDWLNCVSLTHTEGLAQSPQYVYHTQHVYQNLLFFALTLQPKLHPSPTTPSPHHTLTLPHP